MPDHPPPSGRSRDPRFATIRPFTSADQAGKPNGELPPGYARTNFEVESVDVSKISNDLERYMDLLTDRILDRTHQPTYRASAEARETLRMEIYSRIKGAPREAQAKVMRHIKEQMLPVWNTTIAPLCKGKLINMADPDVNKDLIDGFNAIFDDMVPALLERVDAQQSHIVALEQKIKDLESGGASKKVTGDVVGVSQETRSEVKETLPIEAEDWL